MPRLGCRHPGVCCSSDTRMESEHLVELPNRAVAPRPGVGKERRRDRGAPRSRRLLGTSGRTPHPRPASPCAARANLSRTSWRSNTSGSCTSAPRGTGRSSSPPRHCLRHHGFLLRPSTAGVLQPAFGVLRLPGECSCWRQLRSPAVPGASPFSRVLKEGPPGGRAFASFPSRSRRPRRHIRPRPPRRFRQPQPGSCRAT